MRHPLQRTGTWLMVLLLLLPAATLAARERTGTICGIVVDESGHGLTRAGVFLMDDSGTILLESTLTDSDGRFVFEGLIPETYQLRAEHTGYLPSGLGPLDARPGRMATAPFVLQQGPSPAGRPGDEALPAAIADDRSATVRTAREEEGGAEPAAEGTLAETLAGVNRDALKELDRPGELFAAAAESRAPARGLSGDLLIGANGSSAGGDQSFLLASLAGRAMGPTRWTVELSRENNPSLFSAGVGGPLLWRVVRTKSAAFELRTVPSNDHGARLPEQTFRFELAERLTGEGQAGDNGFRSVAASWDRHGTARPDDMGLDLFYTSGSDGRGRTDRDGAPFLDNSPGQASLLILGGRFSSEIAADHEVRLDWRHGSLGGDASRLPYASTGYLPGAPGGLVTPLAEGWETVINGSDRWKALDPLHLLCNMEYRIAGGETASRVARPSVGLVYEPCDRMSVTSSVGLALRSSRPGEADSPDSSSDKNGEDQALRHSELEYGLLLEQGFGEGYNLEVNLSVEDVQPASVTDFDPSAAFGTTGGGVLILADGGTARKREMRLSLSKDFGPLLAGTFGTAFLDGSGDITALPAAPGTGTAWAGPGAGNNRIRGVSGHLDTFLPSMGTGILVTFHHLTNFDAGLQERDRSPSGGITGLDLGLRQRVLHTAGLDLQLLMAISGLATKENSFQGLVGSLLGEASPYRRIVGGLRVHF